MNGHFAVFHADMDVQAEDEVRPSHHFEVFDDGVIAFVGKNLLVSPVGERVSAGGGQAQTVFAG